MMISLAPLLAAVLSDSPPHILLILVDDFGWQNSGWHAAAANASAPSYTPRMDELVRNGLDEGIVRAVWHVEREAV